MAATAPWKRTNPRYHEIQVGKAIRGRLWRELGLLLHWARAHGMHVVPAHHPGILVSPGGVEVLRYRVHPQGLAIARIWSIVLRAIDPGGSGTWPRATITYPAGLGEDRVPLIETGLALLGNETIYVEQLTAKSAALTTIELTLEHTGGASGFWIESVSCCELPRAALTLDATDLGVNLETVFPTKPMFDAPNVSAGGIARGWAATQPRRSLVQQWHAPVEITSSSWTNVFTLPHLILPRKDRRSDTTRELTWDCWAGADAGTKGEYRIVTGIDANTDTLGVATGATAGWLGTSTVEARCEDLSEPDGLPGGSDESVTLQGRVTSGAGAITSRGFSVWEAP